jgi:hypothetical protein
VEQEDAMNLSEDPGSNVVETLVGGLKLETPVARIRIRWSAELITKVNRCSRREAVPKHVGTVLLQDRKPNLGIGCESGTTSEPLMLTACLQYEEITQGSSTAR